ncbi:MAG: hypothetical protein KIS88_10580 [Anaerolineales bacterium]|nr:hypothetical protein [Anaerolineales bacterium]
MGALVGRGVGQVSKQLQTNLAVMASEGTATIAYLDAFQKAGLQPAMILDLRLVPRYRPTELVVRLLGLRITWFLIRILRQFQLRRPYMRKLARAIQAHFQGSPDFFTPIDYSRYSANVLRLYAFGLDDPKLREYLERSPQPAWLYSTSGIMPESLLSLPGKRFIHLHPGVVPFVRGGDCLLWSRAVRGKPGMSCFYMNAGIDTGDIIATHEFEPLRFGVDKTKYTPDQLYEAVMAFYDVLLRGDLLHRLLVTHGSEADYSRLPSQKQDPAEGRTFFTMHGALRAQILQDLFLA